VKPVVFKTVNFAYNYEPGSQSSINLLVALSSLENIDTFRSPTIQAILKYKWSLVKR